MNFLGVILVMALAITFVSAHRQDYQQDYQQNYVQEYPQVYPRIYRYNLTLQTGNHSFEFKGLTKIRFSLNGYNYSYTNLTTYGTPDNYTKEIELNFSLANAKNVSIEWDYKWIDYPEFLIYKPKLIVKCFSIIPIYKSNHQVYRDAEARNHQQQDIDLNLYDLNQYDLNQYGLSHYDDLINPSRYGLEYQYYNSKNPNHRFNNYNYRPNSFKKYLTKNQLINHSKKGYQKQNYVSENGLYNHRYRERIHKFCPPVEKQKDGIEARNATALFRCN